MLDKWLKCFEKTEIDKQLLIKIYSDIEVLYNQYHRFYHNLSHIRNLLELSDNFESELKSKFIVDISIWFHDIIYIPQNTNNEELSAEISVEYLKKLNFINSVTNKIYDYIISTKNHFYTNKNSDSDLNYFLDFDLATLGADKETYNTYSNHIRQEHLFVPENIYKHKRIEILNNFLKQKNIYKTQTFKDLYEMQARKNINAEIISLSK